MVIDLPELENLVAVGSVTEHGARLWYRSGRPGQLWLRVWPDGSAPDRALPIGLPHDADRDGTGAVTYPDDFAPQPPLAPESRYRFRITRGALNGEAPDAREELVGEGRFETAPPSDSPRSNFCFAVMSCHQPFRADGSVAPRAAIMLDQLEPALQRHGAKYSILLGDQIYADIPAALSPFASGGPLEEHAARGLPVSAIRAAYQRRYRQFWCTAMGACLAQRPAYIGLDDHELFDNWGSRPEHRSEAWQPLCAGALDAAFDYQLARNLPDARRSAAPYHHAFRWGRSATFIADIRSQRWAEKGRGEIFALDQVAALASFLEQHDDCGALFIGVSVPIVFLPSWFMRLGLAWPGGHPAARDRWNWPGWGRAADRLLELLLRQRKRRPRQQLVLLSGDIHEALLAAVQPPSGMPIYQFVSSPVTNTSLGVLGRLAHAASRTTRSVDCHEARLPVTWLPGTPGASGNPCADLNVGIVEVDAGLGEASLRFKVLSPSSSAGELQVVFDSGPLEPR